MAKKFSSLSSWIRNFGPSKGQGYRLLCFPHAGGGASAYSSWSGKMSANGIEVGAIQYPGREDRIDEPLISSDKRLVQAIVDEWDQLTIGKPYSLFGHSMGALLAFEVVRELIKRRISPLPDRLFLSAANPPHIPREDWHPDLISDELLLSKIVIRYSGLPKEVASNRELMSLLAPVFRSDFKLVCNYRIEGDILCNLPFSIFGGLEDLTVIPERLKEWSVYTTGDCKSAFFDGDHFFTQHSQADVLNTIISDISSSSKRLNV